MGDSGLGIPAGLLRAHAAPGVPPMPGELDASLGAQPTAVGTDDFRRRSAAAGDRAGGAGAESPTRAVPLAAAPWAGQLAPAAAGGGVAALIGAGLGGWQPAAGVAAVGALVALAVTGRRGQGAARLGPVSQRLGRSRSRPGTLVATTVAATGVLGLPAVVNAWLTHRAHASADARTAIALGVAAASAASLPATVALVRRMAGADAARISAVAAAGLVWWGLCEAGATTTSSPWLIAIAFGFGAAGLTLSWVATATGVAAIVNPAQVAPAWALTAVTGLAGSVVAAIVLDALVGSSGTRTVLVAMAPAGAVLGLVVWRGSARLGTDLAYAARPHAGPAPAHGESGPARGTESPSAIEVRGLDFSYGIQPVLFDISFSVAQGEVAVLLGTNGAGKSTLLRAVAGLDHPTRGTIQIFGEDSTFAEAEQLVTNGVGLLSGGRMTFPGLSVAENLRVGAQASGRDTASKREAVDEALSRFTALAAKRDQRAGTLSGGEQQMLALSRVLMARPRLLLIDELTLGLAPKVIEDLLGVVRAVNAEGTTVLLVEQSVNLALALSGHALFLERGEVRFDGATADLMRRDDLLRPVFLGGA